MSVQLATRNYANNKRKNQNAFPTIKRYDIMEALLSKDIGDNYKDRLSNMFSEILYMEKENMQYIDAITVSSASDVEIFDLLEKRKQVRTMGF